MTATVPVAFLGLGRMGAPMSAALARAGHAVTTWNRTAGKAPPGLKEAATPADAVARAQVVITMLSDTAATEAVLFSSGVLERLSSGTLVIVMSSLAPAHSRRHYESLAKHGLRALDAPVSGGVEAARAGNLAIMVGGDEGVSADARPFLAAMGHPTYVGPPGSGQLAKLANQIIVAASISAVAEALMLARAGGADPAAVRQAMRGGFADSRILDLHGQRMLDRDFSPRGSCRDQLKDLDHILKEATAAGIQLPVTDVTRALFARLCATGRDGLDHSAAFLALEDLNRPGASWIPRWQHGD